MFHSFMRSLMGAILVMILPAMAWAADGDLRVIKTQGQVDVIDARGNVRERAKTGTVLKAGETIRTAENSKAAIRTQIGDTFILDAAAAARVRSEKNALEQVVGKILYLFTPGLREERLVHVHTAVIGIRGTTFLVNAEEGRADVGLRDGLLEISSIHAGFNIYQRKEMDEFEAYKQRDRAKVKEMKEEFEQYRAQIKEEFVAFKKSLQLQANQSLAIAGDKAVISTLDEEVIKAMQQLEQFVSDTVADPKGLKQ